jgi:hypothetical protein
VTGNASIGAIVDLGRGAVGLVLDAVVMPRGCRRRPFETLTAVEEALWGVVSRASQEQQLALLNAHPDLAGRAALAGDVTAESSEEQRRAGLSRCTPPPTPAHLAQPPAPAALPCLAPPCPALAGHVDGISPNSALLGHCGLHTAASRRPRWRALRG